jgi:hypothetical protein
VSSWTLSASYLSLLKTGGRTHALSSEMIFLGRWCVVIPLGLQGFNPGSALVSGGPRIRITDSLTELETAQVKAGGTSPQHTQQANILLAFIAGTEPTHSTRLKQRQQRAAQTRRHTTIAKIIIIMKITSWS